MDAYALIEKIGGTRFIFNAPSNVEVLAEVWNDLVERFPGYDKIITFDVEDDEIAGISLNCDDSIEAFIDEEKWEWSK